jgi:hypothetical protein
VHLITQDVLLVYFGTGKRVMLGVISLPNIITVLVFAEHTEQQRFLGYEVVRVANVERNVFWNVTQWSIVGRR